MDAIERIEVAVRTQICLQMAITYNDSHWHMKSNLFKSEFDHEKFIKKCIQQQKNSEEGFVKHYKDTYTYPEMLPCWMTIELLPLGTWSIIYKNLKNRSDKKSISDVFQLSPIELGSWLHALTYIRNLCAHHSRLWNRHFTITPEQVIEFKLLLTPNTTFAAQAAMIHVFLEIISPDSKWTTKLYDLVRTHGFIDPLIMGFNPDWQNDRFWRIKSK